jgi:hypothetical protein
MTNTTYTTAPTIHLIAWGPTPATPAGNLKVGDVTVWNYGYHEVVTEVVPTGTQSVKVTMRSNRTGDLFTRTMRCNRLVGISNTVR